MSFKKLLSKYWDIFPYIFFGICTMMINTISYYISTHLLKCSIMTSTILAWLLAVLFAYLTNRQWVFKSNTHGTNAILKEMLSFFACRLATGFADWGCMFIFVIILEMNDVVIKAMANILVIILNYIASKLIIFRKSM